MRFPKRDGARGSNLPSSLFAWWILRDGGDASPESSIRTRLDPTHLSASLVPQSPLFPEASLWHGGFVARGVKGLPFSRREVQ